jgi:hypothetical protein
LALGEGRRAGAEGEAEINMPSFLLLRTVALFKYSQSS